MRKEASARLELVADLGQQLLSLRQRRCLLRLLAYELIERADDEERLLAEMYAGVEWQRMRLRNDQRLEAWSGVAPADA